MLLRPHQWVCGRLQRIEFYFLFVGAPCTTWTGCWASLVDDVLLMLVLLYGWLPLCGVIQLGGERTPPYYTSREGKYSCNVSNEELDMNICCDFCVKSKLSAYCLKHNLGIV